eukprot:6878662-Karenia_brevis.AAC.1
MDEIEARSRQIGGRGDTPPRASELHTGGRRPQRGSSGGGNGGGYTEVVRWRPREDTRSPVTNRIDSALEDRRRPPQRRDLSIRDRGRPRGDPRDIVAVTRGAWSTVPWSQQRRMS